MTAKQWKLLEILDDFGGQGAIEVEIQFGDYDFGDGEEAEAKGWRVGRLVVAGLMRTLAKKGLAVLDAPSPFCGYDITEKGRELLQKHRARMQKRQS